MSIFRQLIDFDRQLAAAWWCDVYSPLKKTETSYSLHFWLLRKRCPSIRAAFGMYVNETNFTHSCMALLIHTRLVNTG